MVQPKYEAQKSDHPLDSYARKSSVESSRRTAAIAFDFAAIRYFNEEAIRYFSEEYVHCLDSPLFIVLPILCNDSI